MQIVIPLVMTVGLFGALGGEPTVLIKDSGWIFGKIPAGTPTWIQNAGFAWVLSLVPLGALCWWGMNNLKVETAVASLAKENGFLGNDKVRIPLPASLQKAEGLMRQVGMGSYADELTTTMNRAAEAAVPEAKTLLVGAVRNMSVTDAKNILMGGNDAATQYFRKNTEVAIAGKFKPIVSKSMQKVKLAEKYDQFAGKGAQFGLVDQKDARLDDYITRMMLMGLVTKNAILLVDFAIRARKPGIDADGQRVDGMERSAALLMAAKVRLRPILMTTLAMIFGMLPLAFAMTEGSEQRAPMGQAVIGGVITSSLLTLVVVPVVYCYMDDLAQWLRRRWGGSDASAG